MLFGEARGDFWEQRVGRGICGRGPESTDFLAALAESRIGGKQRDLVLHQTPQLHSFPFMAFVLCDSATRKGWFLFCKSWLSQAGSLSRIDWEEG